MNRKCDHVLHWKAGAKKISDKNNFIDDLKQFSAHCKKLSLQKKDVRTCVITEETSRLWEPVAEPLRNWKIVLLNYRKEVEFQPKKNDNQKHADAFTIYELDLEIDSIARILDGMHAYVEHYANGKNTKDI